MKTNLGVALVAGAVVLAGCGSGSPKAGPFSFKAGTTATIANVKTGATIHCLGIETAPVPPLGQERDWTPNAVGASGEIKLIHHGDGSVTISCIR